MNARVAVILLAGMLALGAMFLWQRPEPEPAPRAAPAKAAPAKPAKPKPVEVVAELRFADGKRIAGPGRIEAKQGEVLRLRIESDRADELHVHGYDFQVNLAPKEPAELRFPLVHAGRFEIELHRTHGTVAVLEVQPRP